MYVCMMYVGEGKLQQLLCRFFELYKNTELSFCKWFEGNGNGVCCMVHQLCTYIHTYIRTYVGAQLVDHAAHAPCMPYKVCPPSAA